MPLAQVVLFGFAIRTDVNDIRLAIVDAAPDAQSLALRARFAGTDRFRVVATAGSAALLEPLFRRGQADRPLGVPPGAGGARGGHPRRRGPQVGRRADRRGEGAPLDFPGGEAARH